jgi:phage shock protein PspC (stress-responsive transcriptional regulator)
MIRTVSINLGGIVFQIDEDAYESLRRYLDSVTQYYKYQEGRDEIVSDIESRFAEIFSESLAKTGFDVISLGDVEEVVEIMGRPEDFDGEGERFDAGEGTASAGPRRTRGKILYRDKDRAVLAGVCSGLSAYWGIADPLWLRLAFIATALFSAGTVGIVVYIILWIVVPEATTSSQKLEMTGEPVNLSNLEKKIRSEINEAGERISGLAESEASSGFRRLVNGIGKLFGAVAKVALVVIKIALIVFVAGLVIALVVSLIAMLFSFLVSLPLALKYIFTGVGGWLLALLGGLLVLILPMIFLIYLPFRLFSRRRVRNPKFTSMGIGLFIMGVILSLAAASIAASYFSERESVSTQVLVPYPASDTLYLTINDDAEDYDHLDYNIRFSTLLSFTKELETASDWVELDIVPSADENVYLEQVYRARGRSVKKAKANAEAITYEAQMLPNEIRFDPVFGMGDQKKWRSQGVKLKLKVPEGLVIVPSYDITAILDDAENTVNASIYTVAGNRWIMRGGELEPIDSTLTLGSEWSKKNMENLGLQDFDRIDIRGDVDVEIVQSDKFETFMIANARTRDELDIDKEGSTLIISREGWHWGDVSIGFLSKDIIDPKFYIALPDMQALDVHKQADVVATGFVQDQLILDCGGQSHVSLEGFEVGDLEADIHAQSTLEISGEAVNFNLITSGQSNFDGESFSVDHLEIRMSGQSDAEMIVNKTVEGELSGQSDFEYWGSPEVDITTYGQSDVDSRD